MSFHSWGQVVLPHTRTNWDTTPSGWTDTPVDSYLTSFACSGNNGAKFDTSGDLKIVNLDSSPDKLSFVVKSNASTTSSLLVSESDDGVTYTTLVNLSGTSDLPTTCTSKGLYQLKATTRYVKWVFTKGSSNMTMDDVSITKLTTSCVSPAAQATSFTSSAILQNTATVGWSRGSGDNVLVVARLGGVVNADPVSGTNYTANSAFGSGTQIGTGNYVVYNGTGSSVNLTGLTAGTNYHFAVYEYNTIGICYNLTKLTGNITTASPPTLTASGTLNEATLNGATVGLTLANTTFADATLSSSNFTLNNAPSGVSIQSVTYNSSTTATVTLAYNNTDFDTNVTNFNITVNGSELASASNLTSNNLTITAVTETLTVGSTLAFGTVCNGSSRELSFTISGTGLKAGTISLGSLAGYTYSEASGGTSITGFTHSGGDLPSKTIYVTLTPTAANQTYNGNISVSGGGATTVNKAVTGNSTATAQAITTNTITTFAQTTATLRATSITQGTCPSSTVQGFVYSVKSTNATPTVGGGGVTNVTVTLGSTTYNATSLSEGTTYAVQAYLFDGTTYVYGGVQEFTTTFTGTLNNVTGATACLTDDGGTISWIAPSSGVVPTGYMVFAVTGATTPSGAPTTALTDYNYANSSFAASTNNAAPSTLGKLLYKGTATSVDISGLTENGIYSFMILAYQDGGSVRRFSNGSAGSRALNLIAQDDVKTFTGTPSNTQVTLNWTHNNVATCFDEVMIVANQGTVTYVPSGDGSSIIADDSWNNAGNQVVYKGTALSKAVTGFTNGTEYCFKIFVRKGTTWSDGTNVCVTPEITYCDSSGNIDYNTGVRYVKFNTIENATAATKTVGYTNFTTPTTTVVKGETYPLTVRVNTDGDYTIAAKVWFDWNHDGDFADSGEEFDLGTATNVADGVTSLSPLSITVPTTAVSGSIKMRVSAKYSTAPTSCETAFDGEVEDYTVTITQPTNQEINIKGNNISIPNNFDEPYGLNNTLFAATNLGTDSVEKEFVIENLGLANLNLTGTPIVNITGLNPSDFIVTQQAVSPVVNGITTSFKIKFHPTVAGLREANVSIANNDADENPYVFKIQGTGTCTTSPSITAFPVSGPANTKVTFTTSVNDLTGAAVTYNGASVPFDLISSGKIETLIPTGATDANFVVTLASGCSFTQAFDVIDNLVTDCESAGGSGGSVTPASDIIIYELYDENGGSGGIVTLYNRTGATVNLSTYSIQRAGDYGGTYTTYANLTGTVASGAVAVIGVSSSVCGYAPTGNGSFGSTGFNANDGFRLMKGSTIIDDVHAPNTVGYYLRRKNEYLSPKTVFDANEWTSQVLSSGQCLSPSDVAQPPVAKNPPVVNTQPTYSLSCDVVDTSLAITATEGFAGGNGLAYQWYELGNTGSWTAVSNGGVYSGATSPTLNISDVNGLDNYQYYCQVRENTQTCYTATKAVQIRPASNTWASNVWSNGTPVLGSKVIIAGSYNSQTNGALDVCELTVSSTGIMLVKPNYPIKVKKKITNQNSTVNSFVVESDANLIQTDNIANEGTIKVERQVSDMNNVTGHIDYVYWSSPVAGQTIKGAGGFSPNTPSNGYLQYNESTDKFTVTSDATFQTGKGYAIRAENSLPDGYGKTYSFTGVPNNGNLQFSSLQKSAGADKGYNLVGNPYPSNISFDLLYSLNSSKIYNTAWFWTNIDYTATQMGSGYTGNNYAVFNGSGGVPPAYDWADYDPENPSGITPNGNIKVGQAFIVQAKTAGALDFNNGIRITDNGTFYQKGVTKNRFWLTMRSPKNMVNTILIGYIPGASNNYETDFDGELFVVGSDSFYSVLGAKKLAIQGKEDNFSNEDVVTLGNVFSADGSYIISLQTPEGIFDGSQTIYLKDKLLNKYINLSTDTNYTFTALKGTDTSRFEIVYKENAVLGTGINSKSDFVVYKDANYQVVKSSNKLGKVEMFDASGKLIKVFNTNSNDIRIDTSSLLYGVYILKIENSGDPKTKKFIK
ncbi:hypothetical protein GCM10007332_13820 [Epilithonimonas arachidiradicis]|uniref:Secreted protein (Por secretion system target) n=2 Tax=Epilithonimonas arachidiradicis TaxID=1617282 RepID=A0ABQ1X1G1_9FLAO|nr:hypothetical protein GCM10007332_13820 [Epilithonimonas arachidiradicis]